MGKQEGPIAFRANEDDKAKLEYLKKRTGLGVAPIIRLAITRLFDAEKKQDK